MTYYEDVDDEYSLALFFDGLRKNIEEDYKEKKFSYKKKCELIRIWRRSRNETMKLNDALLKNCPNLRKVDEAM